MEVEILNVEFLDIVVDVIERTSPFGLMLLTLFWFIDRQMRVVLPIIKEHIIVNSAVMGKLDSYIVKQDEVTKSIRDYIGEQEVVIKRIEEYIQNIDTRLAIVEGVYRNITTGQVVNDGTGTSTN